MASSIDKPKHIKYWQRCFATYLPSAYTANDSTRVTFAFFIASALDLLSAPLSSQDRSSICSWVLSLQHPEGGFCGSPTHMLSGQDAPKGSANLAATFFALLLLGVAADTDDEAKAAFAGVERRKLLRWLKKLQRQDGSFGQVLWDGEAVGGRDMRHSYLASCIRWMLRGALRDGADGWEEDIDVGRMIDHIRHTQTYDGGAAEASEHESHVGYAYCAIGALYMLDRPQSSTGPHDDSSAIKKGVPNRNSLVRFLVYRQFNYLAKEEEDDSDDDNENFIETKLGDLALMDECKHVGFNGRWNKKADTCYCWWVAGTLAMVNSFYAVNIAPSRRYLLDITQHKIGGFSKHAGGHPDLYHSYLGLATLALMGDTDLKDFDVGLCCSKETIRKLELAREGLLDGYDGRAKDAKSDEFWESIKGKK
ncbi:geranylgeranyl transferase type-1 subunit beta [Conoideocrella luteorostrata]|uniref:Geranylgeranyl transferase type-1 subunit beta n=1 Tax=Conoideocrella luteorostrata TaxID=1105319 RepID=A0AAJ0FWM9_9HYPO|nr:geranylgeranyl transferase type-1 subunit beta [Conoideocrella luteorostrata]